MGLRVIVDRWQRLKRAFIYAGAGIWHTIKTEANFQYHLVSATIVVGLGFYLQVKRWEWVGLLIAIGLVLVAEAFNTSMERMVDLAVGDQYSPLAKAAKDVAAGSVLLAAVIAAFIGGLIFIPYFVHF